jgi:tRNA threonylcarbamoyl adenosine modification protein YeaZ
VLVVVLDTSTPAVTAGLVRVGPEGRTELVAHRRTIDARAHGERLAPAVADVLSEAGARPGDLAALVAGLGPGPFTGLRVGLVTAASMAHALAIPAYGICSLDGIGARTTTASGLPGDAPRPASDLRRDAPRTAAGLPGDEPGTGPDVLVATDARRKEVYWAVYRDGRRIAGPDVHRPDDLPAVLRERGLAVGVAVGDGAVRYRDGLAWPVLDEPRYPDPLALAEHAAAAIRAGAPAGELTPIYLRRPDAVEPGARKRVSA